RAAHRRLTAALLRLQAKTLEWLQQPEPTCATFIASTVHDEAGLLLRAFDLVTLTPWLLFGLVSRIILSIVLSFIVFMFASEAIFGDTVDNLGATEGVLGIVLLICFFVALAPPLIAVFSGLVRGAPFAFGYEGVVGAATLRIMPVPLPIWY